MDKNDKELKVDFTVMEALVFGWKKLFERPLFFAGAVFIFAFVPTLVTLPLDIMAKSKDGMESTMILLASIIIFLILQMAFVAGFLKILINTEKGEEVSYKEFMNKGKYIPKLIGAYLLYSLIVVVGLIFFIIPGIFLAVRLNFFDFLIVDKDMGIIESLTESFMMTKGYGWKIFGLVFIMAPIMIFFGMLLFLVGMLFTAAIVFLAQAYIYAKVKEGVIVS